MMGLEFVRDKSTKEVYEVEADVGGRVARHAQSRGLIVRPLGNMAVLSPPLSFTEDQIGKIGSILEESIRATQDDLAGQ